MNLTEDSVCGVLCTCESSSVGKNRKKETGRREFGGLWT